MFLLNYCCKWFAWGRCLRTHCSLPLSAGEMPQWDVEIVHVQSVWRLTCQTETVGGTKTQHVRTPKLLFFFGNVGRESSLTTFCGKGVCCLWVICVYGESLWSICKPTWPTGSNDWSHTCFPPTFVEQYPAVCVINVGSGRKISSSERWKLPWKSGI